MARWQPGSDDRLVEAAVTLFEERGFEATTVADIAARAGLTERTFFRYYTDKREVLFAGEDAFGHEFLDAVTAAPDPESARDLVRAVLGAAEGIFTDDQRAYSRRRQRVIDATPALQERELLKLTRLAAALADAMAGRGLAPLTARVTAELTMAVFTTSFRRWVAPGETRSLAALQREAWAEATAVVAG